MAQLKKIWIERDLTSIDEETNGAIRIDWDNDRHQRIEIRGKTPKDVAEALKEAGSLINAERVAGKI